jgi:hypothetical protein
VCLINLRVLNRFAEAQRSQERVRKPGRQRIQGRVAGRFQPFRAWRGMTADWQEERVVRAEGSLFAVAIE